MLSKTLASKFYVFRIKHSNTNIAFCALQRTLGFAIVLGGAIVTLRNLVQ